MTAEGTRDEPLSKQEACVLGMTLVLVERYRKWVEDGRPVRR